LYDNFDIIKKVLAVDIPTEALPQLKLIIFKILGKVYPLRYNNIGTRVGAIVVK